ncbi:MAG: RNA polymerase sigma factor [Thermodesulfobacteriota bacterium]
MPEAAVEKTDTPEDRVAALARRAGEKNPRAFEELCGMFSARVFRMVYFRVRSKMDAEDLTQEIFMAAFRSMDRLKDPEKFAPWLFSIAKNKVADHLRKKKITSLFFLNRAREDEAPEEDNAPAEGQDALEEVLRREFWEKVDGFTAGLSRMEKEVFSLRFFSGLGLKEIAQVTKKDESTVKTHLYRAVAKFRDREDLRAFFKENA